MVLGGKQSGGFWRKVIDSMMERLTSPLSQLALGHGEVKEVMP